MISGKFKYLLLNLNFGKLLFLSMKIYFGISFLLCFFTAYGEKILPVKIKCVYNSCQSQFLIMDSEKPLTIIYDMEIDYTYLYTIAFRRIK